MSNSPGAAPLGRSESYDYDPWLHGFTIVVMVATFVLLVAGGNVTSRAAGLSVPDWPLSFNHVNPTGWTSNFGGTQPGVRDEHGHRLIGATVGVLVTALAIWLGARDSRRWVKWMGLAAFIGVVIQGLMGGLRVTEKSVALAVLHGCFAQAFFCLTVALVAVTSWRWAVDRGESIGGRQVAPFDDVAATRPQNLGLAWAAVGCLLVVYLQLVLGVILRQTQTTWITHFSWAAIVGLALITLTRFIYQHPHARYALSGGAITLLVLYGLQIVLGLVTLMVVYSMWSRGIRDPQTALQVWLPTIHLAVGAFILGKTAYLVVRSLAIGRRAAESMSESSALEGVPA